MSAAPLDKLERFTRLAFLRRRRALRDEERVELDGLMKQLCGHIEGFHPPARRTRVAVPDQTSTASPSPRRPDGPVGGAGDVDPFEEKTEPPETGGSEPDALPPNVQSVDLGQQRSTYTPKKQAVFLEDYYGEDFVPDRTGELPKLVVDASGEAVQATGDLQWFLREGAVSQEGAPPTEGEQPTGPEADLALDVAAKPGGSPQADATTGSSRPRTAAATAGRPEPPPRPREPSAIVHLKAGGALRGRPKSWPPADGLEIEGPKGPSRVAFDELLAVFATGVEPQRLAPEFGVEVQLANDKTLKGRTMDYVRGAKFFTMVPDPKRPGVDVVWIPAHAVKAIKRY